MAIFFSQVLTAQHAAPVFHCLNGDTLTWSLPSVNCTDLQHVSIFFSEDQEGPFTLLSQVTDPSVTWFEHDIPGNRFYYLTSTYASCVVAGPTSFASDTIGTVALSEVQIERLNVTEDGLVNVRWHLHPSPTIIAYVIEKTLVDQGTTVILDTVFAGNEYLDLTSEANDHPEFYRVWGYDLCGNETSYPQDPHTTIHLKDSADFCSNAIHLFWDQYTGWQAPIEINVVYFGENGSVPDPEHSVMGDGNFLGVLNASREVEYCIYVLSTEQGTGVTARSNTICIRPDVLLPLTTLSLDNVTVEGDEVQIHWEYNSNADLNSLNLELSADGGSSFETLTPFDGMFPAMDLNQHPDPIGDPQMQAYHYRLTAVDQCDTVVRSAIGASMHLSVEATDQNANIIDWTPFEIGARTLLSYSLCKFAGQNIAEAPDLPTDQTEFVEAVDPLTASLEVCYQVKAYHTNSDGTDTLEARSNMACLEQKVEAYVPNAFAPTGVNNLFKPEFAFSSGITDYRMTIFNRWGVKLFETEDPFQGWDGRVNGELLPIGVYTYVIEIEQGGAEKQVLPGTVTMIR